MSKEIRLKISDRLDGIITEIADRLGVNKTDYIKSLILHDLRKNFEDEVRE